jgi:tetratricopeptide (TPR) repeat protein
MGLGRVLLAQDTPQFPSFNAVQQDKFNQLFFDALREKALENFDEAFVLFKEAYKLDPKNDVVCYELGILYFNRNNWLQAEDLLKKATVIAPQNPYYLEALAEVYNKTGKRIPEAEVWEALALLEPDEFAYQLQAAAAYTEGKDLKKASAVLKKLEARMGLNIDIVEARQAIFLKEGKVKKAAKEMERLIAIEPNPEYYRNLGQLYTANEMEKEALEVYKRMYNQFPTNPIANLELAEHHRKKGDMTTAFQYIKVAAASEELGIDPKIQILVSLFQFTEMDTSLLSDSYELAEITIATHPRDPKGYAMLGDFLLRDKKFTAARTAFRTATQLPNGDKANIWNQILILDAELQLTDSLKADALQANNLFPSQPLPYLMLGYAYVEEKQFAAAVEILESGLVYTLGNRMLELQFKEVLADAYYQLKDYKKSDAYFDEILALEPDNAGILNNYAYFLAVRGEHLNRALQMTERSNQLQPNNPTFLDTKAWVLFKKGDYPAALQVMEIISTLNGLTNGEVLEHYGDILYKNQQPEKALEFWKKAQEMGDASDHITQKIKEQRYVE